MFSRIAVRAVSRQGASAILTRRAVPALCHSAKALSSIPKLQKSQAQVQVQSLPSLACSFNDLPPAASFSTSIPRFARRRETKVPTEANGPVGSSLIPIINRLQEVVVASGSTTQLNLPQIVVIGSQSSGKSSVLESLVGKDFLPRGSGIVTRRPLILQLNHVDQEEEWGEFGHIPNRKFFDFSLIRQEIVLETDRTTGKYNVIADPIILRVYSPKVLPLTLVDTPGITRVPLPGQAADIELQIRRIVDTYIVPSNAIILAVTPANQDVSTSDSLNIARSVDPEGNRTIGVLTKLDIMDRGTSALNVLQGRTIPLKHGYVGIVNRSQQDIELNKSISSHLQYEEEFFRTNTNYSQLRGKAGARFLGLKCNRLLTKHIHDVLPEIKKDIKNRLQAANKELVELGQSPSESINDKRWLLLQLINKFSLEFHNTLFGFSNTVSTKEIIGGARIRYIFEEIFRKKIEKLKPVNNLTIDEYRTAICNASGPKSSLFVPDGAFEALIKQHIHLLREPSLQCADMVMQEVSKIITSIDLKELDRFHILREKINRVIIKVLKKSITGAQTSINNFIDYESSYINTNHPDFHSMSQLRESSTSSADDMPVQSQKQSGGSGLFGFFKKKPDAPKETNEDLNDMRIPVEMTDREKQQIRLTRDLLERYFRIVQKNAYDSTIKIVWKHMILDTMDAVHKSFINEIYQDEDPNYLLQESEFIKERRLALQSEIEVLENARKILQETETVSMSELQSDLL